MRCSQDAPPECSCKLVIDSMQGGKFGKILLEDWLSVEEPEVVADISNVQAPATAESQPSDEAGPGDIRVLFSGKDRHIWKYEVGVKGKKLFVDVGYRNKQIQTFEFEWKGEPIKFRVKAKYGVCNAILTDDYLEILSSVDCGHRNFEFPKSLTAALEDLREVQVVSVEEQRLAAEKRAEEMRLAEERRIAEEERIAAEKRAREETAIAVAANLGPRFALVIGNGSYSEAPLNNPPNDSQLMAETLRGLGFTVRLLNDVTQNEMRTAVVDFGMQLEDSGSDAIGLFYYAGHGVQVRGQNYLMPVSMPNIGREADVGIFAVAANDVLSQMHFAGNSMNIVILDACRNNPYARGFRGTSTRGLAQMDAPRGTIVAYSTRPGDLASDGTGRYSPYTEALTTAMRLPGLSLGDVFIQTRVAVMSATNEHQVPWEEGGLTAKFYFRPVAFVSPGKVEDVISRPEKFENLKQRCIDIGFEPGTETFGGCLLKLMDQP